MTSPRRAEFRFPCDSPEQALRLVKSLSVEAGAGPPRTRVRLASEHSWLVLYIEAPDSRGLRAAANSFLRWIHTALEVDRLAGREPESFKRSAPSPR